jgi:hypothetical protein
MDTWPTPKKREKEKNQPNKRKAKFTSPCKHICFGVTLSHPPPHPLMWPSLLCVCVCVSSGQECLFP